MPNSHRPRDKIGLSCLCRVRVWIESARQVSSASECVRRSHRAARHTSTQTRQNAPVCLSDRLNSHSHIRHDKTVLSVSCLARQSKLALIICYACSLETLKENFRLEVETKTGQICLSCRQCCLQFARILSSFFLAPVYLLLQQLSFFHKYFAHYSTGVSGLSFSADCLMHIDLKRLLLLTSSESFLSGFSSSQTFSYSSAH